jgi:hypothetical protein
MKRIDAALEKWDALSDNERRLIERQLTIRATLKAQKNATREFCLLHDCTEQAVPRRVSGALYLETTIAAVMENMLRQIGHLEEEKARLAFRLELIERPSLTNRLRELNK